MKGLGGRNFQEERSLRVERSLVRQGQGNEAKEGPAGGKGRGKREGKREEMGSKLWVES